MKGDFGGIQSPGLSPEPAQAERTQQGHTGASIVYLPFIFPLLSVFQQVAAVTTSLTFRPLFELRPSAFTCLQMG